MVRQQVEPRNRIVDVYFFLNIALPPTVVPLLVSQLVIQDLPEPRSIFLIRRSPELSAGLVGLQPHLLHEIRGVDLLADWSGCCESATSDGHQVVPVTVEA